jgi:hypothetical protein
MFFKKLNSLIIDLYLHRPFIAAESAAYIFFIFFGLVRFTLAQVVSSPPFPLLGAASPPADIATHAVPCYAFFPLSKAELTTPALSSGNASSRRLPS